VTCPPKNRKVVTAGDAIIIEDSSEFLADVKYVLGQH